MTDARGAGGIACWPSAPAVSQHSVCVVVNWRPATLCSAWWQESRLRSRSQVNSIVSEREGLVDRQPHADLMSYLNKRPPGLVDHGLVVRWTISGRTPVQDSSRYLASLQQSGLVS
jgi:hypothetical protein